MKLIFEFKLESFVNLFSQMNHLEYKNFIRHSLQVAKMTRQLAKMINLKMDLDCAYLSGMLHDIGLVIKASVENYELFADMFRRVPDLEKLVLTFDKADRHSHISYLIASLIKPLCPECAKSILYHHTPYQKIPESNVVIVQLASCLKASDLISLADLKYSEGEMTVELMNEMMNSLEKDGGIVDDVKKAALQMLNDYKLICELLDDEHRFNSARSLSLEEFERALHVLAALIDLRSPYTRNHTFLVNKFSKVLTLELMSKEDSNFMGVVALVHDIGKLKTPLSILHKRGSLDEKELLIMRRHVVDTYFMLEKADLASLAKIAASHHERLDGTGYPTSLKADQTSIFQRIIQICDVFSALVEHRPYREALSTEQALSVIENEVNMGRLDGLVYNKLKELFKNKYFEEEEIFKDVLSQLFGEKQRDSDQVDVLSNWRDEP